MNSFYSLPSAVQIAIISSIVSTVVTIAMAIWNFAAQQDLEELKGKIEQATALNNAKQDYEFDARKRLYIRVFPLLFQLKEAAESSYYGIVNLTGSYRNHKPSRFAKEALVRNGELDRRQYYLNFTLYRLFRPLAIYRLLQRSTTFFDFTLDDEISAKYFLLKIAFICFTDHFGIARADDALLPYEPDDPLSQSLRETNPARYWRQGILSGHLERLCDAMIVETPDGPRTMTYGEFEKAAAFDDEFQPAIGPAIDVFFGFAFDQRPVLARVLLLQACIMRMLFLETTKATKPEEFLQLVSTFSASAQARQDLQWWGDSADVWQKVESYLSKQIKWVFPNGSTPDF